MLLFAVGSDSDDDTVTAGGGGAMRQAPRMTELNAAFESAKTYLKDRLHVNTADPNYERSYISMLKTMKDFAQNVETDPKRAADMFSNTLAPLVYAHISLKVDILEAFDNGTITQEQKFMMLDALATTWKDMLDWLLSGTGDALSHISPLYGEYRTAFDSGNYDQIDAFCTKTYGDGRVRYQEEGRVISMVPIPVGIQEPPETETLEPTPEVPLPQVVAPIEVEPEVRGEGYGYTAFKLKGFDGLWFQISQEVRPGVYSQPAYVGLAPDILEFFKKVSEGTIQISAVNMRGNDMYELIYDDGSGSKSYYVNRNTNIMTAIAAASGLSVGSFDQLSAEERVAKFKEGATALTETNAAREGMQEWTSLPGVSEQRQPTTGKKKNWFDTILGYLEKIFSLIGMYYAFTNILNLLGMGKDASLDEARKFEATSRSFYYTMQALRQNWGNLDRGFDDTFGNNPGDSPGDQGYGPTG